MSKMTGKYYFEYKIEWPRHVINWRGKKFVVHGMTLMAQRKKT